MPYIHSGSSALYPGMGMGSVVMPSSSGGYYGMPSQHYYPNYAYGGDTTAAATGAIQAAIRAPR
ncbi:hypothetical protein B0H13DRAFT_2333125 [Mycena leptocephala]|nr:hypothetical protein B0H13DRAFT_2333125 [Mycena leptocephala]